eukprot:UN17485
MPPAFTTLENLLILKVYLPALISHLRHNTKQYRHSSQAIHQYDWVNLAMGILTELGKFSSSNSGFVRTSIMI